MVQMYPSINSTDVGSNVMNLWVYSNSVTHQFFVLFVLIAFFLVVLISSLVMQIRMTSRVRFEVSFLAASFASLGFTVIMAQVNGLINPIYFFIFIGLTIVSFLWVALSSGE
jgi:hypothetical protein